MHPQEGTAVPISVQMTGSLTDVSRNAVLSDFVRLIPLVLGEHVTVSAWYPALNEAAQFGSPVKTQPGYWADGTGCLQDKAAGRLGGLEKLWGFHHHHGLPEGTDIAVDGQVCTAPCGTEMMPTFDCEQI